VPLVSSTLRILRNIDLVRYDTKGNEKVYWLKDRTVAEICLVLEKVVTRMRHKKW
jgi:hypothetical protein